jgi:hypothetical protein
MDGLPGSQMQEQASMKQEYEKWEEKQHNKHYTTVLNW